MAQKTGTYDIQSLFAARTTLATTIGIDEVARVLNQDNANFSASLTEVLSEFSETSTDKDATTAGSVGGDMMEVDEYGQGPTQKDQTGELIYFPLRKFQYPVGWTKQWEKNATGADYAVKNAAAQGADLRRHRYELMKAIFVPTNYTFKDFLVSGVTFPANGVKAFFNADGTAIPNGPNGEVFDGSTHTHYDGSATLTAAAVTATVNDVIEHRTGARVRIYINRANEAAFSALTGFTTLLIPQLTVNTATNQIAAPRLDISRLDNRQIGFYNGAEVWTKPWVPANYLAVIDLDAPQKPLRRRVELNDRGLHIAGEVDIHPLRAQYIEHFYGFAALNRLAVAVLKFDNATYSAPTLTY